LARPHPFQTEGSGRPQKLAYMKIF
jgi:hypothetical protein